VQQEDRASRIRWRLWYLASRLVLIAGILVAVLLPHHCRVVPFYNCPRIGGGPCFSAVCTGAGTGLRLGVAFAGVVAMALMEAVAWRGRMRVPRALRQFFEAQG
jgi:hypothetical protein